VLRFYAGYGTNEIAWVLGSSRATVRVHLSRAADGCETPCRRTRDKDDVERGFRVVDTLAATDLRPEIERRMAEPAKRPNPWRPLGLEAGPE
jgi:predicted transcriptional regulator